MKTTNFDSEIKAILTQLLDENDWVLIKPKGFFKRHLPYKLVSMDFFKKNSSGMEIEDNFQNIQLQSIGERSPNWIVKVSPVKIFSTIVNKISPQFIDDLFKNYEHICSFHQCFLSLKKTRPELAKKIFTEAKDSIHSSKYRTMEEEESILKNAQKLFTKQEFPDALKSFLSNHNAVYFHSMDKHKFQFFLHDFIKNNIDQKDQFKFNTYIPDVVKSNQEKISDDIFKDPLNKTFFIHLDLKAFYQIIKIPQADPKNISDIYNQIIRRVIQFIDKDMKHFGILSCTDFKADSLGLKNKHDYTTLLVRHQDDSYYKSEEIKQFFLNTSKYLAQNHHVLKQNTDAYEKSQTMLENFSKIEFNDFLENNLNVKETKAKKLKI